MLNIIPNWHPIFVHLSVGVLSAAVLFFAAAKIAAGKPWSGFLGTVARGNLWLGAVVTLATVATGWYAFNTVEHDTISHAVMKVHRNWALATAVVFLILALWSWRAYRRPGGESGAFVGASIVALALLMTTGWYGGELVFRHGLGVMSLPESHSQDNGHHHDAAASSRESLDNPAPAAGGQGAAGDGSHGDGHDHTH